MPRIGSPNGETSPWRAAPDSALGPNRNDRSNGEAIRETFAARTWGTPNASEPTAVCRSQQPRVRFRCSTEARGRLDIGRVVCPLQRLGVALTLVRPPEMNSSAHNRDAGVPGCRSADHNL